MAERGLTEFEKLQAKEIASEAVEQMQRYFLTKKQYWYINASILGVMLVSLISFICTNKEIMRLLFK